MAHQKQFEELQLTYARGRGSHGIKVYYCKDCGRLYIGEKKAEMHRDFFIERQIPYKIYPRELTEQFLKSKRRALKFDTRHKLYIPNEAWTEDRPTCPIHQIRLEDYPFVLSYKDRKVAFTGYYCNQCRKVMIRRTKALDLEEACAEKGIPFVRTADLEQRKPRKKQLTKNEIHPDFYVENGGTAECHYRISKDCYQLTKEDTVVVVDSIYCQLDGHDTEEVMVLITVQTRKNGKKIYLCLAGYCDQCQKYYLSEIDYKVLDDKGRPDITTIFDGEEDDYLIRSGEVFELEKKHFDNLENTFDEKIKDIKDQPDYVEQYAVSSYDDGNLKFAKNASKQKYSELLKQLVDYKEKPYRFRVDLVAGKENITYYLGIDNITIDDKEHVISSESKFGRAVVNYRTTEIEKDGKKYQVKLQRKFDIENAELFGYENQRTDEDIIFRKGGTDPYLIRVLRKRNAQHKLVDIITTIQEKQNEVVDAEFKRHIVVQGCAGSGKTMVLLHRLSAIRSNEPDFSYDTSLILTPNEQFNLHIKDVTDELKLGRIECVSIEQYYMELLEQYSDEFVVKGKMGSETAVKQIFVDHIYSDTFLDDFEVAYQKIMRERKELFDKLVDLGKQIGEEIQPIATGTDYEWMLQIKRRIEQLQVPIDKKGKGIQEAQQALDKVKQRKSDLAERLPNAKERADVVLQETAPKVKAKLAAVITQNKDKINELQEEMNELVTTLENAQQQFMPIGKRAKIEALNIKIEETKKALEKQQILLEEITILYDQEVTTQTDQEVFSWMRAGIKHDQSIRDEVSFCERTKALYEDMRQEADEIDESIEKAANELRVKEADDYSEEIKKQFAQYKQVVGDHVVLDTANSVFKLAVKEITEKYKVKENGATHRYDLYSRLWFAMKFFDKKLGTSKYICVDEGQDLAYNEYILIDKINNEQAVFNVYGDNYQLLKLGRGMATWDRLKESFNMQYFALEQNYRNTNQITRFCNTNFDMNVMYTGVDGSKVGEIQRKSLEEELGSLNIGTERIAILIPRGIPKKDYIHKELLPISISDIIGSEIGKGRIALMYVDEVKGIEFERVYVISNRMTKNEKYIACTRARSELIIVDDENNAAS